MSRRRLGGWEPAVTVTYIFDDDGHKVGERHQREPEFNDEDRAWFDALAVLEGDECPSCRMPMSESTDPEGPRYTAPRPKVCRGCAAVHATAEPYTKGDQSLPIHARRFRVIEEGPHG